MSWKTVLYDESGHVARLTLNRPETHNVLNARMIVELDEAMKKAEADPNIHVVILRGAGPSFTSGHDLSSDPSDPLQQEFRERGRRSVEDRFSVEEEFFLEKCLTIRNLDKPTIASIHGNVVLMGLVLAEMCDLIIAAESTRLWNPSLRHCGTGGELIMMAFDIGFRKTKEFLWTGDVIPVREAERLGLINRVVPDADLEAETLKLAERIALMPPLAVWITKRSLNKIQDFTGLSLANEYHFALHQLAHASKAQADWNQAAAEYAKGKGFKGWLEFRDGPFDKQAREVYQK